MIVREAVDTDVSAIFEVAKSWAGHTPKPYFHPDKFQAVRDAVRSGRKHFLVACEDNVVGFASYEAADNGAFVALIMVERGLRRTGIASALIEELKQRYSSLGAFNDIGPEMRGMYEKWGFHCTDRTPGPFRNWRWDRR